MPMKQHKITEMLMGGHVQPFYEGWYTVLNRKQSNKSKPKNADISALCYEAT